MRFGSDACSHVMIRPRYANAHTSNTTQKPIVIFKTPRAVAEASEVVFSIVTDATAVKDVALGPQGIASGLRRGGVYIDMSSPTPTLPHVVAHELSHQIAARVVAGLCFGNADLGEGQLSIGVDRGVGNAVGQRGSVVARDED